MISRFRSISRSLVQSYTQIYVHSPLVPGIGTGIGIGIGIVPGIGTDRIGRIQALGRSLGRPSPPMKYFSNT